jgi:hypothetical protein
MTQHNRDKMLNMPTPQGEAKGLDTNGKRAKHNATSGDTKSSQSMNAGSPLTNVCTLQFSSELSIPLFLPLDEKTLPLVLQNASLPLVMNWMSLVF